MDYNDENIMPDGVNKNTNVIVLATEAIATCSSQNNDPVPCQRKPMNVSGGKILIKNDN